MITMIACVDRKMGIGQSGELLAYVPDDLKHFKKTTEGKTCVFGRKTYESLPVQPLPNRETIVMTRSDKMYPIGVAKVRHFETLVQMSKQIGDHFYICGGGEIYKRFMPHADELIITHVDNEFEADAFFPEIDESIWQQVNIKTLTDKQNYCNIITYRRRGN